MQTWARWKKVIRKRIPLIGAVSDFIYPYREELRVFLRKNLRKRAYPKDYFERLFVTRGNPWKYDTKHQRERLEMLLSFVPDAQEMILEIGCAEGHFTHLVASKTKRLIALDLSLSAIRRARDRVGLPGIDFLEADLLTLPFHSSFPAVVCAGVLVYFAEHSLFEKAASEVLRVLAPNGFLILENMWEKSGGNLEGRFIHNHFTSIPELMLIRHIHHKEYGISVFQKTASNPIPVT